MIILYLIDSPLTYFRKFCHNVECFILESVFMERILLATVYPNLTELKLYNFDQQIALKYFTGKYLTCTPPNQEKCQIAGNIVNLILTFL